MALMKPHGSPDIHHRSDEVRLVPEAALPLPRRHPGRHARAWQPPHSRETLSRVADALRVLPARAQGQQR